MCVAFAMLRREVEAHGSWNRRRVQRKARRRSFDANSLQVLPRGEMLGISDAFALRQVGVKLCIAIMYCTGRLFLSLPKGHHLCTGKLTIFGLHLVHRQPAS